MTDSLINLFAYAFDLFIILAFYNNTLIYRKENVPSFAFYGSFCLMEILLFANEMLTTPMSNDQYRQLLTVSISFLTSYALTFLYRSSQRHRLYSAIIFQFLAMLGENIFTLIVSYLRPSLFSIEDTALYSIMNLGSKVVLFFLALIVSMIWRRQFSIQSIRYHISLLVTPFISLLLMLLTPLEDIMLGNNRTFFLCLYLVLVLLNILNYRFIRTSLRQERELHQMEQMKQQIAFQKEKYLQLGAAYKTNRRLIHDTKKHYFILQEYLKQKKYDELFQYLKLSIEDMENTYAEINTGNLVIDAFVSNFKNVAQSHNIPFSSTLRVDADRIPIDDYELCVILGNLLDNSFNACRKNTERLNHISLTVTVSENDMFYIHIENTYDRDTASPDNPLEHGYGLQNIINIVEKNHGFFKYAFEDLFSADVVIPIINVKKRLHPPVY